MPNLPDYKLKIFTDALIALEAEFMNAASTGPDADCQRVSAYARRGGCEVIAEDDLVDRL
jgi:hypothetical protein